MASQVINLFTLSHWFDLAGVKSAK